MEYLVITYTPSHQGILAPVPEKWTVEETEKDSLHAVVEGLHVPQGGYCQVVGLPFVIKVRGKTINEVVG